MTSRKHEDNEEAGLPAPPTVTPEVLHKRVSELEKNHEALHEDIHGDDGLHKRMETISLSVYWVNAIKGIIIGSGPFVAALLTWGAWVTDGLYDLKGFMSQGPRFTQTDANNLELRVNANTEQVVSAALKPIKDGLDRIDTQGTTRGQAIYTDVDALKKQIADSAIDRARLNTKLDNVIESQKKMEAMLERLLNRQ